LTECQPEGSFNTRDGAFTLADIRPEVRIQAMGVNALFSKTAGGQRGSERNASRANTTGFQNTAVGHSGLEIPTALSTRCRCKQRLL